MNPSTPAAVAEPAELRLQDTVSICPECRTRVPAGIVRRGRSVHLVKQCPVHGEQVELLEQDADYYEARTFYDKPGTPSKVQTPVRDGCPFDCGLCPEHDQHTCIGLIEINGECELACPDCYTVRGAAPTLGLEQIARMMDFFQDAESGRAEVLQISGGEPTRHPRILDILRLAKDKRFKYVLLNTNGLRIAEEPEFVRDLSRLLPKFEVYLQFDGLEAASHARLRGRDLGAQKRRAVALLGDAGIPVTLVATIQGGANEHEIGAILRYGLETPGVRGVNYQPLAFYRRAAPAERAGRITLTGILEQIERQTAGEYLVKDFVPLPCDVERVALTFCYRDGERFVPITRRVNLLDHLPVINNTFAFNADDYLAQAGCDSDLCGCMRGFLDRLRPLIPADFGGRTVGEKVRHFNRNMFRISVSSFVDVYNFDLRSMQRECVHVITPDLRRIPFSAYNMFHRSA